MALADWDARLLTPEDGLRLVGDWPVHFAAAFADLAQYGDQPGKLQINMRCGNCGQSCGLLADIPTREMPLHGFDGPDTTLGDLLSGILRHLVTAHDLSLSGAAQPQFCLSCRAVLVAGHETDPGYHEKTCEIIHG